ncbi:hypothetical protein SDC9_162326 [bioreactor metagenome]|uniref:Uncharacterized protein n=1 Tax=bioreactor metagenome TaxID=1076179 RepID=A0A645FKQ8_9ZZZZ
MSDVHLFIFGVTRQTNHFHAIEQRSRNVQRVCRRHEHHVRQVEIHLNVMILEGVVLLRVQHLEQRGRRITTEVLTELIDLVEQEQRVTITNLAHVLQDLARHRADVSPAMTTNLGLGPYSTQRHAHELAIGCLGD